MDLAILRQVIEEHIPFNKFLGIRAIRIEPGTVLLELPFREELIGDPLRKALHGGAVSTLADVAGGMAVWGALEDPMSRVSTVDLRIDYLRPGRQHALLAEGIVVRIGGRVAVTDMKMYHPGSESEPIATGKGVYAIKTPKSPPKSSEH